MNNALLRAAGVISDHVKGEGLTAEQMSAQHLAHQVAVHHKVSEIRSALISDETDGGYDLMAGRFGPAFSAFVRRCVETEEKLRVAEGPAWQRAFKAEVDTLKVWALLNAVDALLSNEEHRVSEGVRDYQKGSPTWKYWKDLSDARKAVGQ